MSAERGAKKRAKINTAIRMVEALQRDADECEIPRLELRLREIHGLLTRCRTDPTDIPKGEEVEEIDEEDYWGGTMEEVLAEGPTDRPDSGERGEPDPFIDVKGTLGWLADKLKAGESIHPMKTRKVAVTLREAADRLRTGAGEGELEELERLREYKASREAQVRGEVDEDTRTLSHDDADYLRILACRGKTVVRPAWLRDFADRIDATLTGQGFTAGVSGPEVTDSGNPIQPYPAPDVDSGVIDVLVLRAETTATGAERRDVVKMADEWFAADFADSGSTYKLVQALRDEVIQLRGDPVASVRVEDGVLEKVSKIGPTPPDGRYVLVPATDMSLSRSASPPTKRRTMATIDTLPPVVSFEPTPLQKLCSLVTDHRLTAVLTPWREGHSLMGDIWQRTIYCRLCKRSWYEWQTWEPTDTP